MTLIFDLASTGNPYFFAKSPLQVFLLSPINMISYLIYDLYDFYGDIPDLFGISWHTILSIIGKS